MDFRQTALALPVPYRVAKSRRGLTEIGFEGAGEHRRTAETVGQRHFFNAVIFVEQEITRRLQTDA